MTAKQKSRRLRVGFCILMQPLMNAWEHGAVYNCDVSPAVEQRKAEIRSGFETRKCMGGPCAICTD